MVAYFNRLVLEHPLSAKQKQKLKEYNEEVAAWHKHKALAQTQIREYQRLKQCCNILKGWISLKCRPNSVMRTPVISGGRIILVLTG